MKTTDLQRQSANPVTEPFATYLVLSAVAHGLLAMGVLVGAWFWGSPLTYTPSSYTVSLVDAPLSLRQPAAAGGGKAPSGQQAKSRKRQVPPRSKAPKTVRVATPSQTVKAKPKPRRKPTRADSSSRRRTATRKRTRPPQRAAAKARKPGHSMTKRRRPRTTNARSVSKAERAKQRAAEQRLAALRQRFGSGGAEGPATEATIGLQEVRLRAYQELVREQVIEAWILPMSPEAARMLQATALLSVDRDGRVTRLELLKSSGNPLFDDSLLRAIKQAAPLPALPEDYRGEQLEVELRFRAGDA